MDEENILLWKQRIQNCLASNNTTTNFFADFLEPNAFQHIYKGRSKTGGIFCTPVVSLMLEKFISNATHIYFACGPTDFRKQTESLTSLVSAQFKLNPYLEDCVFVFCNKKRNVIKVLRSAFLRAYLVSYEINFFSDNLFWHFSVVHK